MINKQRTLLLIAVFLTAGCLIVMLFSAWELQNPSTWRSKVSSITCSLPNKHPEADCMLKEDIFGWNIVPGFMNPHQKRIWDRETLMPAYRNMGSLYHQKRLLDKLSSGQRIVAAAIGSSYVHDFAGCFQTSMEALYALGVVPNPFIYPQRGQKVSDVDTSRCSSGGYMEGFMHTLNQSWPNPGHVFLNMGKSAVSLWHLSESSCMSSHVPEEVDFVLIDAVTNEAEPWTAEKLVRKFLGTKSEPMVVMFSNLHNCHDLDPVRVLDDPFWACNEHCLKLREVEACDSLGPEPFTRVNNERNANASHPYQTIAAYYDIPHIDMHILMKESFMETSLNKRLNMSKWMLLSQFYIDHTHPKRKDLGTLIVADVLVNLVYLMQQSLIDAEKSGDQLPSTYTMPAHLHEEAKMIYRTRCFGVSFEQVVATAKAAASASNSKVHAQALQQLANASGEFFSGTTNEATTGMHSLPQLAVTKQQGFSIQAYYSTSSGIKFKPGYLASTPGAILEFEVNTDFSDTQGSTTDSITSPPQSSPQVLLLYTASYDGWGTAFVTCTSGCTCDRQIIDSNSGNLTKTSLIYPFEFFVSQHERCTIRLEIAKATSSGGFKFKLSSVMVRIPLAQ